MGRIGALIGALSLGLGMGVAVPTAAQEPSPEESPVFPGVETPLPGFEEYAGCPLLTTGVVRLCISATVSGHIQLGKVAGDIDGVHLVLAAGANVDGTAALVPAPGGGGQPAPVEVPGGLLGIPELQPLLDLDVLHLLTLSATPTLGELQQTGLDGVLASSIFAFILGYPNIGTPILDGDPPAPLPDGGGEICSLFGCFPWPVVQLSVPLNLQLDNTLLGTDCKIGPIDVAVSDEAPAGSSGALTYNDLPSDGGEFHIDGMHLVGTDFAVPGSDCAGLLGTGDLVGSVLGVNPFDAVIDAVAGLPSGPGHNRADLTLDLHIAGQQFVYGDPYVLSTTTIDFGDTVPVGSSDDQQVTITNLRHSPRNFTVSTPGPPFAVVHNACADTPVDAGGTCTFTVRFSPTSTSLRTSGISIGAPPEAVIAGPSNQIAISGRGAA